MAPNLSNSPQVWNDKRLRGGHKDKVRRYDNKFWKKKTEETIPANVAPGKSREADQKHK